MIGIEEAASGQDASSWDCPTDFGTQFIDADDESAMLKSLLGDTATDMTYYEEIKWSNDLGNYLRIQNNHGHSC